MALPSEIITPRGTRRSKLGDLIRRLSSNSDGELVATVHAIRRILESAGADVHAFAEHLEEPVSNGNALAEIARVKKEIFDAGYAKGVQAAEAKHHGADDFLNTDGKPDWRAVALFVQRNKDGLDVKHYQFIDKMAGRTVWGDEPTERMHKYLHGLFFQLGGKIK